MASWRKVSVNQSGAGPAVTSNRRWFLVLAAIAVAYAFLANLQTVEDPDFFWQLATGRWVAQHHHVFSTDVFSYTAPGRPWIYPAGSGLLFYLAYCIGGFALISWMAAAACAGTVALLLRRGSVASAAIAIIAVPLIAGRTVPRAEMFTVVLFAAYLSILWQHYQTGAARLWLLPVLMIAWVNLHPGFASGLALILAFAGMEPLDHFFTGRRDEAVRSVLRLLPWLAATGLATLVNPWGWGIYSALVRQGRVMAIHSGRIVEWGRVPLNWTAVSAGFSLRSPKASFYLLLLIVAIAALAALWQRKVWPAIFLIAAAYLGAQHVRMDALAACIAVVVGGSVLHSEMQPNVSGIRRSPMRSNLAMAVVAMFALLACVRTFDLVRNRRNHTTSRFGAGLTWWVPDGAAEFIERENLPAEIFNTYDEGGYFLWRLGPQRRDYIDNRAIPFGPESFQHQAELLRTPLDSEVWQREADRYNINTILLPLPRFENLGEALRHFCTSVNWRPIYLDEKSVVFVRRKPETEALIQRWPVDCSTAKLPVGPLSQSADGAFNQWANAASILAALHRNSEALEATDKARRIYPDSSFIHHLRGTILSNMGLRAQAEREYLAALALEPGAAMGWFSLAGLYKDEGRIPDAIHAQRRAIDLSSLPQPFELDKLARLYLLAQQPKAALEAFDRAAGAATPDLLAATGQRSFSYNIALGRAEAWRALGDPKRAAMFDDEAVRDLFPQK